MDSHKENSVFAYRDDYRDYLKAALTARSSQRRRGARNAMAEALSCQGAFVSQVIGKKSHFNLEHGEKINGFFEHTEQESHYFLLLLQKTRAGTDSLKAYFDQQLEAILDQRLILTSRIDAQQPLSKEDQMTYYSSWYYGGIRVLLTIPGFQTKETIARRLNLPMSLVTEVLDFLCAKNLAKNVSGTYEITQQRMHLGNEFALIRRHHSNWRMKAIQSLDHEKKLDLHYSSAISISAEDRERIREAIVKLLQEIRPIVRDSPAEELCSLNVDFFEI